MYFQIFYDDIKAALALTYHKDISESLSAEELVYIRWKRYSIQTVPSREAVITTKFPEEDYSIQSQH